MTGPLNKLKFNHIGLALRQAEDAITLLGCLGYTIGGRIYDPLQDVHVRLCTSVEHPSIEFVQPGSEQTPIKSIVTKHGELMYHLCYETPDLAETLEEIERAGLRCIPQTERKPAVLFGGRHVSFYKIVGWGVIELLESQ